MGKTHHHPDGTDPKATLRAYSDEVGCCLGSTVAWAADKMPVGRPPRVQFSMPHRLHSFPGQIEAFEAQMDEIKRLKSASNMGYKMAVDLATWYVSADGRRRAFR